MYAVENVDLKKRKLILLGRFSPDYTQDILIPRIEANCIRYDVERRLVENFHKYKSAENSLYFHHSYIYADVPIGQEYEMIARTKPNWDIIPNSVRECKATVLCFFSAFREYPLAYANVGHHEFSLIKFQGGIPDMIYELHEITEEKPVEITQEICLCSYETCKANGIL